MVGDLLRHHLDEAEEGVVEAVLVGVVLRTALRRPAVIATAAALALRRPVATTPFGRLVILGPLERAGPGAPGEGFGMLVAWTAPLLGERCSAAGLCFFSESSGRRFSTTTCIQNHGSNRGGYRCKQSDGPGFLRR